MTISEGLAEEPATSREPSAAVHTKPWYPPLPVWKLFLLMFLTLGIYSVFFAYRAAKDVRDHGHPRVKPWLYPFCTLIPVASAVASGRLAGFVQRIAGPEREWQWSAPWLVGFLAFVGHLGFGTAELLPFFTLYFAALLLFTLSWLLLQRQINLVKADLPESSFRTPPNRYTRLQAAGMCVGSLFVLLLGFALREDFLRLTGQDLAANEAYTDPLERFAFTAPRAGWTLIKSGYLSPDSDLELLGPGEGDWAVIYVHQQSGWTIDDLVEGRYQEMRESVPSFNEVRRLVGENEVPVSYAKYQGFNALDGTVEYAVASFAEPLRAVEMIVFTTGGARSVSRGEELAASLTPARTP